MSHTAKTTDAAPRERVYDYPNGFRETAQHMFGWLLHAGLAPEWDMGVRDGEYRYGITLGSSDAQQLHDLQRQNPARWGNAPEVAQSLRENQQEIQALSTQNQARRAALTPEQDAWIEVLHYHTGLSASQAMDLNERLHELAAAHFVLCLVDVNEGLSGTQERALEVIEQKAEEALAGVPGVVGAKFLYDPRGSTVGVVFSSGASDSLSGCYKVPLNPTRVEALQRDGAECWNAWADEAKPAP